ncbi:hypothetical protein OAF54_01200 [bacterium]|nr:hypothetical protein [bacterium]
MASKKFKPDFSFRSSGGSELGWGTDIAGYEEIKRKLARFPLTMMDAEEEAIKKMVVDLDGATKKLMRSTPRKGSSFYTLGNSKKKHKRITHRPSQDYFAPAVDTGRLINSLHFWTTKSLTQFSVEGSNFAGVNYAKALHDGTADGTLKPRPFFALARQKVFSQKPMWKYMAESVVPRLRMMGSR